MGQQTYVSGMCRSRRSRRRALTAAAVAGLASAAGGRPASAGTLYWDPGTTGTGNWTAGSGTVWASTATAGPPTASWSNNSSAFFANSNVSSSPYTVTLTTNISAASIEFNTSAAVVIAASGSNVLNVSGGISVDGGAGADTITAKVIATAAQTWTNNSANPFTVNTVTAPGGPVTFAGGTFVLTGTTDNAGFTAVVNSGATLVLAKTSNSLNHSIGSSATVGLTVNSGGTAQLAGAGGAQFYADTEVLINGTLDLNGNSNGFDGLSGSGTVTNTNASSAALTLGQDNNAGGTSLSTFSGVLQNGTGTLALVKTGSGTQILSSSTSSTYTGGTTVSAGTLQIGNAASLPAGGNVTVAAGTLALGANSVSVGTLAFNDGGASSAGLVTGTGTVTATGLTFLNATTSFTDSLNLSGLTALAVTSASNVTLQVADYSTGTLTLAKSTTITAPALAESDYTGGQYANANIVLENNTTLNVGSVSFNSTKTDSTTAFASGLTSPTLTIQGAGGAGTFAAFNLGSVNGTGLTYTNNFSTVGGTVYAYVSSAVIGNANDGTSPYTGRTSLEFATLSVGSGTVEVAGTMTLGQISGGASSSVLEGFGTFNVSGATVYANTIKFGDAEYAVTGAGSTATGFLNLISWTVDAAVIGPRASLTKTSRTINWTAGTIGNLDGTAPVANSSLGASSLSVSGVGIVLVGTANVHNFTISTGQTGTVASVISDAAGSTNSSAGLTVNGPGTLVLTGPSTYGGVTTISSGTVLAGVSNVGTTSGALGTGPVNILSTTGASLLTNGAYTISNPVQVSITPGSGTNAIGGNTDNTSTFSGAIFLAGNASVTQVTNTGANALDLTGPIATNNASGSYTLTFAGPGNIKSTGVLGNGTGTLNVAVTGGTTVLAGTNTYTGGTTVSAGELRANNGTSSTGTGPVTVTSGGTLGGSGTIANGTNAIAVNGTITAGQDDVTVGTLTTGTQNWNSGGTFVVKTTSSSDGTTVLTNDLLVMSALIVPSTGSFTISLTGLSNSTTSFGTSGLLVLANDTDNDSTGTNPFDSANSAATLNALVLSTPGVTVPKGYTLATASDSSLAGKGGTGRGGFDLIVVAAPEPTSLLLAGVAIAPLALRRRRRRRARHCRASGSIRCGSFAGSTNIESSAR